MCVCGGGGGGVCVCVIFFLACLFCLFCMFWFLRYFLFCHNFAQSLVEPLGTLIYFPVDYVNRS